MAHGPPGGSFRYRLSLRAQQALRLESLRDRPRIWRMLSIPTIGPGEFVRAGRRLGLLLTVKPYTMFPYSRMEGFLKLLDELRDRNVPGAFVQCGVWRGGSGGLLAYAAHHDPVPREVWLFDSWEGLPPPTDVDVSVHGHPGAAHMFSAPEDAVRHLLFHELRLPPDRIHLEKGWFDRTIPPAAERIGPIALLHLDCDYYASLRLCLETLAPRVVPGGLVVLDDYTGWHGARKAVDEFLAALPEPPRLEPLDDSTGPERAMYFRVRRPIDPGPPPRAQSFFNAATTFATESAASP